MTSVARYADDAVRVGYGGVATAVGYVAQPFARPVGVKILATGPVESFYEKIMSSGSSSERNGTHVGPGGIPSRISKSMLEPTSFRDSRGETRQSCPRGYELRRVGKRMMCVKR